MARMNRFNALAALLPLILGNLAHAADGLLDTAACRQAQGELAQAWTLMDQHAADAAKRLALARERTAQTCFGQPADQPAGQRSPGPALTANPAAMGRRTPDAAGRASLPERAPSPPAPAPGPAVINSCDAGGCWDSHGARVPRTGPGLSGLSSLCTVQGGLANCP